MAARTFADSAGAVWEVFEVHRSSTRPGSVSGGLEQGWLSFSSGESKRRLAPFPVGWETVPEPELERLCAAARVVTTPKNVFDPSNRDRRRKEAEDAGVPDTGERRRADDGPAELPPASPDGASAHTAVGSGEVETTVRQFAHQARARHMPAIEAMVELKGLLLQRFEEPDSDARDMRRVRRWFVEAYYFEARR